MSKITLGSNVNSLNVQRELHSASNQLSTVFERLSSGQRINRSSDDAAGLAISDSLSVQARVFNQGVRNLNDGISVINIADGAIQQLTSLVTRIRELATQSANGTLSAKQRSSLDKEAQELSEEYTRIVRSTRYNGRLLFDNSYGTLRLQAGFGVDGGIASGLGGKVGDGTFNASTSFAATATTNAVELFDVNADGFDDILIGTATAGNIGVQLSNGDGTFKARELFAAGGTVRDFTFGDFNGDSITDIITSRNNANVSLLLGNGDGSFKAQTQFALGTVVAATVSGDFNNDGIDDLSTIGVEVFNRTYLGNGDGTFRLSHSNTLALGGASIESGDFNGDGITDIAYEERVSGIVGVLIGRGDGSFNPKIHYNSTNGGDNDGLITGDMNGDGLTDIVTAGYASQTVEILLANSDGSFKAPRIYNTNGDTSDVKLGDFNGDGILDVVTSDYGTGPGITILLGNGDGSLKSPNLFTQSGATPNFIAVGDANGDGVQDVLASDFGSARASLFAGNAVDGVSPLLNFSLKTQSQAKNAAASMDRALSRLSLQRSVLGAFQSRAEVGINVNFASAENFTAARSRIIDADIAKESADLVRLKIREQAAAAVLAQVNQAPLLAIKLLSSDD